MFVPRPCRRHLAIALVAAALPLHLAWADEAGGARENPAHGQHAPDGPHHAGGVAGTATHAMPASRELPLLAGQYAFATIAEIVELLERDASTDWSQVDLEALRRHLIDMDRVTLGASVTSADVPGGARFEVTSTSAATVDSIRRMTHAHAATADDGSSGLTWRYTLEERADGVSLTVLGEGEETSARIRALGFIGILVAGTHHPRHHLAIARGASPHEH